MTAPGEITARDVYDAVLVLTGQVQAALMSTDALKATTADHEQRLRAISADMAVLAEVARVAQDHEQRLRAQEKWARAMPLALVLAVLSLAGVVVAVVQSAQ